MGMDAVELILRTEDEFSISISDDEAASAFTVGGLYDLILSKLDTSPGCLTSKAFYLTRRALVESLGVPRRSIRPGTRLSPILPDELRRAQWQQIRNQIGLAMPPLRIPADLKQHLYKRAFTISGVYRNCRLRLRFVARIVAIPGVRLVCDSLGRALGCQHLSCRTFGSAKVGH
jgi:hypothetical protein